jgi:hypothetical protein
MFGLKSRQIFFIILLAAVTYAVVQFIPVYSRSYQFADAVYEDVKFAVSKRESTEKVRMNIVEDAKEFDIPIGPRDIHLTQHGPAFTVEIDYQLLVDFRVYQFQWPRHISASGETYERR